MPNVLARDMNMLFLGPAASLELHDSMTVRPPSAGFSELYYSLARLKNQARISPSYAARGTSAAAITIYIVTKDRMLSDKLSS